MKAGDLVRLRACSQEGKIGMITYTPSADMIDVDHGVWQLLVDGETQHFTTNQMVPL